MEINKLTGLKTQKNELSVPKTVKKVRISKARRNISLPGLDVFRQGGGRIDRFAQKIKRLADISGQRAGESRGVNAAAPTEGPGQDFAAIADLLKEKDSFLILAHQSIDGDDLGSMTALTEALTGMGKTVRLYSEDEVPKNLAFLPQLSRLSKTLPAEKSDVVIALECTQPGRVGEGIDMTKLGDKVVNIDHHQGNPCYGDLNWVNTKSPAVGEMVYDLLTRMGCPMTPETASGIYTAIASDTGSFQFGEVSSKTHRTIARLLETGIDPSELSRKIFREKDFKFMKLYGKALSNLEKSPDGKLVWSFLDHKTLSESGLENSDMQNLVEDLNRVAGTEVMVMYKEAEPGEVHISLRSKSLPINDIAAEFGGGGHQLASGCRIDAPLPEAMSRLNKRILEKLKKPGSPE